MTFELSATDASASSSTAPAGDDVPEEFVIHNKVTHTSRRPVGIAATLRNSKWLFVLPLVNRSRQVTRQCREWSGWGNGPGRLQRQHFITLGVCLLCMFCGPAAIFTNSHVMRRLKFEYPLLITAIGLGTSACAMHCLALFGYCSPQPLRPEVYWREVVPVGALSACTFVLGNASYLYLPVSLIQVLKSLTPVFTLFVSLLDCPEEVSMHLSLAVIVMTMGGCWAVFRSSPGSIHLWGLTLMLLSDICEAVRTVAQQNLFRKASMSLLEALYWYSPVAFFWTLIGVCVMEVPSLTSESLTACTENPVLFLMVALLGLCVNVSAFWVIQLTSALTLKVLVTISSALVVVVSSVALGDILEDEQLTGYLIALSGFIWYQYEKYKISKGPNLPKAEIADNKLDSNGDVAELTRVSNIFCRGASLSLLTIVRSTLNSIWRSSPAYEPSSPKPTP